MFREISLVWESQFRELFMAWWILELIKFLGSVDISS